MKLLRGELVFVTGANRGIGKAIAIAMGKAGATVVGTSTSNHGANDISNYFTKEGIAGVGKRLNIKDKDEIVKTVNATEQEYGLISILINNAGITKDNLLLRMTDDEWQDVLSTNLSGAFFLVKSCIRSMIKNRKGRIINITSIVGAIGSPGQTNYAATKSGLAGFTRSLAAEVASREITVNAIAPGFIDTDMTSQLAKERRNSIEAQIPMGRLGDAKDIADLAVFLASEQASYITGQVIHVNGGLHMT